MIDPSVQIALINSLPGTLAAVFAGIGVIMGFINRGSIKDVHLSLNSRLDQLVSASKDSGIVEERNRITTSDAKTPESVPKSTE